METWDVCGCKRDRREVCSLDDVDRIDNRQRQQVPDVAARRGVCFRVRGMVAIVAMSCMTVYMTIEGRHDRRWHAVMAQLEQQSRAGRVGHIAGRHERAQQRAGQEDRYDKLRASMSMNHGFLLLFCTDGCTSFGFARRRRQYQQPDQTITQRAVTRQPR